MVNDSGIVTCVDAANGNEIWRSRISDSYSASPILAEGRIYFFSEDGRTTVIEAGREFRPLAENTLDDGFMASPPSTAARSTCARRAICIGLRIGDTAVYRLAA